MKLVNEATNNVTPLIGTVFPQEESADAQTQYEVALTTSEKMLKADEDNYVVKSNERSATSTEISTKPSKSVRIASKKSNKSTEEIAEAEESSGKASAPESHIVVCYGSAEENAVAKNTHHELWSKKAVSFLTNNKTCAATAAAILVLVSAVAGVIGSAHANKSNIQAQQIGHDSTPVRGWRVCGWEVRGWKVWKI